MKDDVLGYIRYKTILDKKNKPAVTIPAKPTLPDLYQENFLYCESKKKKANININVTQNTRNEERLDFETASDKKDRPNQGINPMIIESKVSKNFIF